jgi:hypothetical protein
MEKDLKSINQGWDDIFSLLDSLEKEVFRKKTGGQQDNKDPSEKIFPQKDPEI